jgi:succinoglycan biosynthesis protein ExoM
MYEQESRQGIPFGRNRCLSIALSIGAQYVVFVDDDMTVSPQWFNELFSLIVATSADVVTGDVMNVFPDGREEPKYLPRAGDRKTAETDNVIFKSWLAEKLQFDERLALSGGSDTLFFRQAYELGANIRHSDAAVAYEHMHGVRGSRKWFLGRNYRYGLVGVRVERLLGSKRVSIRYLFRGLLAVAFGLGEAILATPRADPTRSFGIYRAARGGGMLMGALGKKADRYL